VARKRNRENIGLPSRWRFRYNAYYYHPPADLREYWDNRAEFRLGRSLSEAHRVYAERLRLVTGDLDPEGNITLNDVIDRYIKEVTPTKAPRSQKSDVEVFGTLRGLIGHNKPDSIKTVHCYRLYDQLKKRGLTTANRHMEKVSHLYTKAIEWGIVSEHPMVGKFRKQHARPARRYLTDEVIDEALKTAPPLVLAYVNLKLLTGLRMSDMLSLKVKDWQDDGLHVTPRKTLHSSAKSLVFERTPELEAAVDAILALPRPHITEYLFCTREGKPYIKKDGTMNGFQSTWQRWQRNLPERFKERDIRVKVGSDSESDEDAARLLGHATSATTRKHYRAKPDVVKPLNRGRTG